MSSSCPIPVECRYCHAGPAALHDDEVGHLSCRMCGWEFLYLRLGGVAAAADLLATERRRRGRAAWPTT